MRASGENQSCLIGGKGFKLPHVFGRKRDVTAWADDKGAALGMGGAGLFGGRNVGRSDGRGDTVGDGMGWEWFSAFLIFEVLWQRHSLLLLMGGY
jgi:hypothetical protein